MEDVLDVYHAPYDPLFPLVCMDESNKQLVGEVHAPLAAAPGRGQIIDHEYVRNGVAEIFLEVEPLSGRRHVEITEQRTRKDWAMFIKGMLDERYPQATKVRLVMDNLNTHSTASLYEAFEPEEARRLAQRLEIHYTPKHGSWLNVVDPEKALSGSRKLRPKAGLLLLYRNPAPSAQQAAQKIAPKSSQELLKVHRRCAQDGIQRISANAFQAVALQPVFRLQMSDAGFDRRAPLHPSPQRTRRSPSLPLVHAHSYFTFIIVAAIPHVHIRLTYLGPNQVTNLL